MLEQSRCETSDLSLTLFWSCVLCWWPSWWHQHIRSLPCTSWSPSRQRWFLPAWSLQWRARRRSPPASLELRNTGGAGTFYHCRGSLRNPLGRTHTGEQGAKKPQGFKKWTRTKKPKRCPGGRINSTESLLTLWVSAEMLVTPFNLKSKGASG